MPGLTRITVQKDGRHAVKRFIFDQYYEQRLAIDTESPPSDPHHVKQLHDKSCWYWPKGGPWTKLLLNEEIRCNKFDVKGWAPRDKSLLLFKFIAIGDTQSPYHYSQQHAESSQQWLRDNGLPSWISASTTRSHKFRSKRSGMFARLTSMFTFLITLAENIDLNPSPTRLLSAPNFQTEPKWPKFRTSSSKMLKNGNVIKLQTKGT